MDRQYVDSSMILSIGYDKDSCLLEIEFKSNGAVWEYRDFPEYLWYEFENADSKGHFFHQRIKGQFNEARVG